jgi:hypothetical protein
MELIMNNINKAQLMKRAWEIKRNSLFEDVLFSEALKIAWDEGKATVYHPPITLNRLNFLALSLTKVYYDKIIPFNHHLLIEFKDIKKALYSEAENFTSQNQEIFFLKIREIEGHFKGFQFAYDFEIEYLSRAVIAGSPVVEKRRIIGKEGFLKRMDFVIVGQIYEEYKTDMQKVEKITCGEKVIEYPYFA